MYAVFNLTLNKEINFAASLFVQIFYGLFAVKL